MLDIDDRETGKKLRLLFSGDIGRPDNDLLADPEGCENVDHIIMESTYGGRKHELATDATDRICQIIRRILQQKGKLIIPAFAVERTQQLLYTLDQLRQDVLDGTLPQVSWICATKAGSEHPSPSSPAQGSGRSWRLSNEPSSRGTVSRP